MQQYLIPPGQKSAEGDRTSRSFEDVLQTYAFMIRRVDVVLLSYDITSLESCQDLEFWVKAIQPLCQDFTGFILVGTHLDRAGLREVTPDMVNAGCQFFHEAVSDEKPGWHAMIRAVEVSNASGENFG